MHALISLLQRLEKRHTPSTRMGRRHLSTHIHTQTPGVAAAGPERRVADCCVSGGQRAGRAKVHGADCSAKSACKGRGEGVVSGGAKDVIVRLFLCVVVTVE